MEYFNDALFWLIVLAIIGVVTRVSYQMVFKRKQRQIVHRKRGRFTVIDGGKRFQK